MENNYQKEKSEIKISVNKNYLIYGALGLIILSLLGYILFSNLKEKSPQNTEKQITTDTLKASIKVDTAQTIKQNPSEYDENYEEGEPFTKCYVIANKAFLRSTPSNTPESVVQEVTFGKEIYVKEYYALSGNYATVYLVKPENENTTTPAYYLASSTVVSEYEFESFKESFSLPQFSELDSKVKKLILKNNYFDGKNYAMTQNAAKAPKAITFGDFDADGIKDVAVIMDDTANQQSRMLVICYNKVTKEPYLAYTLNFSDYVMISSFKKNAKIFMDTEELIPSPAEGILYASESSKEALVFDVSTKKFKSYNQLYNSQE